MDHILLGKFNPRTFELLKSFCFRGSRNHHQFTKKTKNSPSFENQQTTTCLVLWDPFSRIPIAILMAVFFNKVLRLEPTNKGPRCWETQWDASPTRSSKRQAARKRARPLKFIPTSVAWLVDVKCSKFSQRFQQFPIFYQPTNHQSFRRMRSLSFVAGPQVSEKMAAEKWGQGYS